MQKKPVAIHILLTITLLFILGNSLLSKQDSSHLSRDIALPILKPILSLFVGDAGVTDILVRKCMHFLEFSLAGIEIALLFQYGKKVSFLTLFHVLSAGLFLCVLDESIQLFASRGSQVQDILLDYAGFLFGVLCLLAILSLIRHFHRKHTGKPA